MPETIIEEALPELVPVRVVCPLATQVAVYAVIVLPPSEAGALKLTVALPNPAIALEIDGFPGTEGLAMVILCETAVAAA